MGAILKTKRGYYQGWLPTSKEEKMLEDSYAPVGEKRAERCKPDYEKMITKNKEKLRLNTDFQEAIFAYTGNTRLRNKMAELIGELVTEERMLQKNIQQLIKNQEENED